MRKLEGRDVVIVEALRTPVGRGHKEKGYYKDVHPNELLGYAYKALFASTGVDPIDVDDVIVGCVQQLGVQSYNIGRNAWLQAGLPIEVPATTVDRQCGSAQQGINFAATQIASGVSDIAIGAGVEHMGMIPFTAGDEAQRQFGTPWPEEFMEVHQIVGQGLGAELLADHYGVSREVCDELALRSHQLADQATREGRFEREMIPVEIDGQRITTDQGIRPDTTLEKLSSLRTVFKENGKITAGNSSQISDGAAAVLLMTFDEAQRRGLKPRARVVDQVTVGCDPIKVLEGPLPATHKILKRNDLKFGDIDLFEVNEAFAPVVAAWANEFDADMDKVNVNGGAMALGHPVGSTGARLTATLISELERADKELGFLTMCCGGGIGTGTLFERL
ncbi:MAG: thiolase family protein [Patulibacter sp.]|nr:thiolase family protein [Patulibacter sp.]